MPGQKKQSPFLLDDIPLKNIIELAPAILLMYYDHKCIYANKQATAITGYSLNEISEMHLWDFAHPDFKTQIAEAAENFYQGKIDDISVLIKILTKEGKEKWIDGHMERIAYGKSTAALIIGVDVSEMVEARLISLHNEIRLQSILDTIPSPMFYKDKEGLYTGCNNAFSAFLGLTKEKIIGKNVFDITPANLAAIYKKKDEELFRNKSQQIYEAQVRHSDKTYHDVIFHKSALTDSEGKITGLVGILHDVTESRKTEQALRESELFLKTLIYSINEGVFVLDSSFNIIIWNSSCVRLTGIPEKMIIGKQPFSFFPFIKDNIIMLEKALSGEIVHTDDIRFEIPEAGKSGWLTAVFQPHRNAKNETVGIIGIFYDITARKLSEQHIIQSEEKFRNIFNASSDAIFITDLAGYLLEINESTFRFLSMEKKELQKKSIYELFPAFYETTIDYYLDGINELEEQHFEADIITRADEKRFIEITGRNIHFLGNKAILHICRDITDRKMIEAKILTTIIETEEKERRSFSEDLHDELGPFLSGIKLYLNSLGDAQLPNEQRTQLVNYLKEMVDEAIDKTRTISNKLMPSVLIDYGLIKALESFAVKIEATNFIKIKIDPGDPSARYPKTVEVILYRTLIELINNTIKHADAKNINIAIRLKKKQLLISYRDDGRGFNLGEVLKSNSGMGVRNMLNRIRSIHGKYDFESTPKKGMKITFTIDLYFV